MPKIAGGRFLVTGGAGFIGSHLVAALLGQGASSVVVLDSLELGAETNLVDDPRIELVPFNLGFDDPKLLRLALSDARGVFHLAAHKHSQESLPEQLLQSNVNGTHTLLREATESGVEKVVYASSLYAYGRHSGPPMVERELPEPTTTYGVSKVAAEHLLRAVLDPAGIGHVSLRYFFIYGPRQYCGKGRSSVVVETFRRLIDDQPARLTGSGEQRFDYVFVDDAVRAALLAMERPVSGSVLNVASGHGTSIREVIASCMEVAGTRTPPDEGPADETEGTSRIGDPELAAKLLDFRATIPLAEGLSRTLAWMRSDEQAWR